jgi:hypothetical protein
MNSASTKTIAANPALILCIDDSEIGLRAAWLGLVPKQCSAGGKARLYGGNQRCYSSPDVAVQIPLTGAARFRALGIRGGNSGGSASLECGHRGLIA